MLAANPAEAGLTANKVGSFTVKGDLGCLPWLRNIGGIVTERLAKRVLARCKVYSYCNVYRSVTVALPLKALSAGLRLRCVTGC